MHFGRNALENAGENQELGIVNLPPRGLQYRCEAGKRSRPRVPDCLPGKYCGIDGLPRDSANDQTECAKLQEPEGNTGD